MWTRQEVSMGQDESSPWWAVVPGVGWVTGGRGGRGLHSVILDVSLRFLYKNNNLPEDSQASTSSANSGPPLIPPPALLASEGSSKGLGGRGVYGSIERPQALHAPPTLTTQEQRFPRGVLSEAEAALAQTVTLLPESPTRTSEVAIEGEDYMDVAPYNRPKAAKPPPSTELLVQLPPPKPDKTRR